MQNAAIGGNRAARWIAPAIVLLVYAFLLAITANVDPGDTRDYANSIAARFAGRDLYFWESGHLLWRPLGYLLVLVAYPVHPGVAQGALFQKAVHALTAASIAMGGVALLAFLAFQRRLGVRVVSAVGATIVLALTCAFLNFAQSGSSYVPAFAMLLMALWALASSGAPARVGAVSGVAFAASVLLWLPMVFVVPVAALSQLILRGDDRGRRSAAALACVVSGAIVIAAYAGVAVIERLYSAVLYRAWLLEASHGIRDSGGAARAVIGLARSSLSTAQLGIVAKRFLLGDPFAPATFADVVRAGLSRVLVFYAALALLLVALAWYRQWRVLAFLALTAIPVLALAISWQGGDPERYFALFPALFLAVGVALSGPPARAGALCTAALITIYVALNFGDYSRATSAQTCAALARRMQSVPSIGGRPALVVTMTADELTTIRGRCPDASILGRSDAPHLYGVFAPHVANAVQWRRMFAERALAAWGNGERVWISTGLLRPSPPAEWHWAEGEDTRVHWRDFPAFFRRLSLCERCGGSRSFVEVIASPGDVALLDSARRVAR